MKPIYQDFWGHRKDRQTPVKATSYGHGLRPADSLLQAVDGGLAGVILLVPFLMGGRHPLGQFVLVVLAVFTAVAWALRQWRSRSPSWQTTWTPLFFLAGAGWVLLQTLALPDVFLQWLAPNLAHALPLWQNTLASSAAGFGIWPTISMTPDETRVGLALFVAYGLVFLVAVQRIERIDDVERLLRWCALSAVCVALFGLIQYFAGNGKFFWFYQHPETNTLECVKGCFSNRNHFADFLAIGIGPLIWWVQDVTRRMQGQCHGQSARGSDGRRDELQAYLLGLALVVVVFAGLLSLSRGGMLAMLIACAVCTLICYRASVVGGKVLLGLGAAALLIGAALTVFGYDRVANRVDDISSGSLEQLDQGQGRRTIWAATAQGIPDHLMAGAGVGSFPEVYPMYADISRNAGMIATHSENCYLQVPLETGGVGLALILAGIMACGYWCIAGCSAAVPERGRLCAGAAAASLAAFAAHGAVDFVWYVPACSATIAVLAACALRVCQLSRRQPTRARVPMPGWMPAATVAVLLMIGSWMIVHCIGPALAAPYWDRYLIALYSRDADTPYTANSNASPSDCKQVEKVREMTACLEDVVQRQPSHFRAQLALAELHLQSFDMLQASSVNPMSLGSVRDAVVQSRFPTREAMVAWLSRAVGDHWIHLERALDCTRKAIALSPLEGRGYIYLADLAFLEGNRGPSKLDCVSQALRVRPFDGTVLYAAGNEAYLAGDLAKWLDYMKQAFHCGPIYQHRLIADFIGNTATEGLPAMIELILREFEPDIDGARFLYTTCANRCRPEDLSMVCRVWAEKAEQAAREAKDSRAVLLWMEALRLHAQLKEPSRALECACNALKSDPNHYQARYEYAVCLIEQERFADAELHLHWCLQRSPGDAAVAVKLKEALRGRLNVERSAAVLSESRR